VEPTLVPNQDCNGVIGGDAVIDECGVCEGPGKTGCDSTCGSTVQLDCTGECGGNARRDCNDVCNGTHHLEYFCEESDSLGVALDLSTRTLTCFAAADIGNCNPRATSCDFVDCNVDTMYKNTVINCHGALPELMLTGEFPSIIDSLEDGACTEWSFQNVNCKEFEFDGGDCNLIDCNGLHFSNDYCIDQWGYGCVGNESSLGDTFCDDGNDDVLPVNFNCAKWGYDGASCNTGWTGELGTESYSCAGEISGSDCSD